MAQLAERMEQLVAMGQLLTAAMAQLAERLAQLAELAKFLTLARS
jgi:hypothetical protein